MIYASFLNVVGCGWLTAGFSEGSFGSCRLRKDRLGRHSNGPISQEQTRDSELELGSSLERLLKMKRGHRNGDDAAGCEQSTRGLGSELHTNEHSLSINLFPSCLEGYLRRIPRTNTAGIFAPGGSESTLTPPPPTITLLSEDLVFWEHESALGIPHRKANRATRSNHMLRSRICGSNFILRLYVSRLQSETVSLHTRQDHVEDSI